MAEKLNEYDNYILYKFKDILDFKQWGKNQELSLFFTDITYTLNVINESEYKDNEGNIDTALAIKACTYYMHVCQGVSDKTCINIENVKSVLEKYRNKIENKNDTNR